MRKRDRATMMVRGFATILIIIANFLTGCGGILSGDFFPNEQHVGGTAAHLVYRAPVDCRVGIARTHNGRYLLYEMTSDGVPPREGQILEGPVRLGRSVFQIYRADRNQNWRAGQSVSIEVLKAGLSLENAGEELERACAES